MYLSKIDIRGFKSFANTSGLEFQRGITAIVGPNGSGKSNVADAIRWVLGEQSLKLLRGKRSDDVIFAGSDKKQRLGVAEVSMTLNNEDRGAPIDYSELVITRRVYRDGQGEYLINHQLTRLQDIQLMLAQANFGQRTYSVIGQGMIDSFLLSSPQERKHLFDEAAGVRQYQLKREQAVHKLLQSKENLVQGEAIMNEIEPRLRSLTRQVRRLERREGVEKELRQARHRYFGLRRQEVERELTALRGEHQVAEKRRDSIGQELGVIQNELEIIERERTASENFSNLQKNYNSILDEKNRLLEQQAMLKGRMELTARQTGAGEMAYLGKRAAELKRLMTTLDDEQAEDEHHAERERQSLTTAESELAAIEHRFRQLETKATTLQTQLREQVSLPDVHRAISGWSAKFRELVEHLHAETADLATLRKRAKHLDQELGTILGKIQAPDGQAQPLALTELQQQLLETAHSRQTTYQRVAELRGQRQLRQAQSEQRAVEHHKLAAELERIEKDLSVQELAKTNPDEAYAVAARETKQLEQTLATVDARLKAAREEINNFNALETTKKERLFALQKQFRSVQHEFNHAQNAVNDLSVRLARVDQRADDLQREIIQALGEIGPSEVESLLKTTIDGQVDLLAEDIGRLSHQLQLIGGIDDTVTNEFQETNERWEFLSKQAKDLRAGISSLESAIADLDAIIGQRFDTAFKKINDEFNTYFRALFRGGRADLVLIKEVVREDDDLTEAEAAMAEDDAQPVPEVKLKKNEEKVVTGIDIKATPPGKKLQSIAMLSGGERALTSIALLCAIIANNPSPFVVLDEVDAALDEANSQRFAAILDQLAHKTQFVTITHNRATMEKASILYGVTMGDDGISQLLSVKMDEAEKIIQQHGNR